MKKISMKVLFSFWAGTVFGVILLGAVVGGAVLDRQGVFAWLNPVMDKIGFSNIKFNQ